MQSANCGAIVPAAKQKGIFVMKKDGENKHGTSYTVKYSYADLVIFTMFADMYKDQGDTVKEQRVRNEIMVIEKYIRSLEKQ